MSDTTLPVTEADGNKVDVAFDVDNNVYTPITYARQYAGTAWSVSQSGAWSVAQSGTWSVSITGTVTVGTHAVTQSGTWTVQHSTTGIGHGVRTVTTAGTDVALAASSTPAKWVTIQAQTDNTGWIAVGASGVDATEASGTGVLLDAGESITIPCDNLNDIYIDATVNGEGVRYTYGT